MTPTAVLRACGWTDQQLAEYARMQDFREVTPAPDGVDFGMTVRMFRGLAWMACEESARARGARVAALLARLCPADARRVRRWCHLLTGLARCQWALFVTQPWELSPAEFALSSGIVSACPARAP